MVFEKQSIKSQNITSKKDVVYIEDIEFEIEKFVREVESMGGKPAANVFYMITNIPKENKICEVEFFLELDKEINSVKKNIKFHSYFGIDNMISIRVSDTSTQGMDNAYRLLGEYIQSNNLQSRTGYFHMLGKSSKGNDYVNIKVGYK